MLTFRLQNDAADANGTILEMADRDVDGVYYEYTPDKLFVQDDLGPTQLVACVKAAVEGRAISH